ncbi:MAG TPA: zinc-binding dehydrogenase, partial [Candidatus Saccharimonadales bacterium]|nr:zinc-binding dehydrogenase [Candidatus Saccharimonadales bacterium]
HANLQSGQKILIHGGAGGIASFAIQLAKHIGAYVTATAAAEDADYVKSLGADAVIDYKTQDFSTSLKDYDVVYDTVGGDTYTKSFQVLKPGGIIVSMVAQPDETLAKQYGVKPILQASHVNVERLTKLAELVDQAAIKVQIGKVFPLEEANEALEYIKQGKHHGKVVIQVVGTS